jgi:hypothetical protein
MGKDITVRDNLPSKDRTELDRLPEPINSEKLLNDVRSLVERSRISNYYQHVGACEKK